MISIKGDKLSVGVNLCGGTLTSVNYAGVGELLWQGDENSWKSQDVVIFPFVARLKDGYYTVDGVKYEMPAHGLMRKREFDIREQTLSKLTIGAKYNQETLTMYPYKFDFTMTYEIISDTLKITFHIENIDDKTMYFGFGAHPAYNLPATEYDNYTDIDGNIIELSEYEDTLLDFDPTFCFPTKAKKVQPFKCVSLTKELFDEYPTFVIEKPKSTSVTLIRADGVEIGFDLGKEPILAFWSAKNRGAYVCVEPWYGLPDNDNVVRELSQKAYIQSLSAGATMEYSYTTKVLKTK